MKPRRSRKKPVKKTPARKISWKRFKNFLYELYARGFIELFINVLLLWGILYFGGLRAEGWPVYACFLGLAVILAEGRTSMFIGSLRAGLFIDFMMLGFASSWVKFAYMT